MIDYECQRFIDSEGTLRRARFRLRKGQIETFEVGEPTDDDGGGNFVAAGVPVDIHCHGIGSFDLSDLNPADLSAINDVGRREGTVFMPSVFISRHQMDALEDLLRHFDRDRSSLAFIGGFSIEGPLLSGSGGTPRHGSWNASRSEWRRIASWGRLGLVYVVLSPGVAKADATEVFPDGDESPTSVWIANELLDAGVKPALGHIPKETPEASALEIRAIIEAARSKGVKLLTDHFLNDMPSNVRYAWRTPSARETRERDLRALRLDEWTIESAGVVLGEVPAAILDGAAQGSLYLFMNFDGDHVDGAVSSRLANLLGAGSVVAMTDRVDAGRVGGNLLRRAEHNSLWMTTRGVVAAGSLTVDDQIANMRSFGMSAAAVWSAACLEARAILGLPRLDEQRLSGFVAGKREWVLIHRPDVPSELIELHAQTDGVPRRDNRA